MNSWCSAALCARRRVLAFGLIGCSPKLSYVNDGVGAPFQHGRDLPCPLRGHVIHDPLPDGLDHATPIAFFTDAIGTPMYFLTLAWAVLLIFLMAVGGAWTTVSFGS